MKGIHVDTNPVAHLEAVRFAMKSYQCLPIQRRPDICITVLEAYSILLPQREELPMMFPLDNV